MENEHLKIKKIIFSSSSPRNNINTKSLIDEKKDEKKKTNNILMRTKTNFKNNNDIVKPKKKSIMSSLKADTNFMYLKNKLQQTIILRPEDIDLSISEDEKSINSKNKSNISNKNYINKRTNKKVSTFKNIN
jgi:hypothetical protein